MTYKATIFSNNNHFSLNKLLFNLFLLLGFAGFTTSLFLPVFFTSAEDIYGYWVLLAGWIGLILIQFAWFANPINLLALLLTKDHPKFALLLSVIALILASETFILKEIPIDINQGKMFIKEFGLGFYIWFAAQLFFLLALLCRFIESLKR